MNAYNIGYIDGSMKVYNTVYADASFNIQGISEKVGALLGVNSPAQK
jgi:hypothetical protein